MRGQAFARIRSCGGYQMSKRKTPAQALEEFLSYYDESISGVMKKLYHQIPPDTVRHFPKTAL